MSIHEKPRVRFAPSPTGHLHVGGARTALYSYLFAKKYGGTFILRIEDTDVERSTEKALKEQMADLEWLELNWDEGPDIKTLKDIGAYGPYRQSNRQNVYKDHAEKLINEGKAYYCFCKEEELEKKRQAALAANKPPQYDGTCRQINISDAEYRIRKGEKAAIRFRVRQDAPISFQDIVRGTVGFPPGMVGDFIIIRSTGMPVYNFCCVIDDAFMEMTHVLRAEEHLSNTLRQIMIYEAFAWELPRFAHLSIILGKDRQKLSKRHGATSCHEFMERGFLPDALLNYLALLGWTHPEEKEILSRQELIDAFSLEKVHASAAVFDEEKLRWVNASHLRALPNEQLWEQLEPFFKKAELKLPEDHQWQHKSLELLKTKLETLADAVELYRPLTQSDLVIEDEGREVLGWESTRKVIAKWKSILEGLDKQYLTTEEFEGIVDRVKTECGVKGKFLFMPIRVAIIGKPHGAELNQLVPLLSTQTLIQRANTCLG